MTTIMPVLGEHFSVLTRHDLLQYLTPNLDLVLLPQLGVMIPVLVAYLPGLFFYLLFSSLSSLWTSAVPEQNILRPVHFLNLLSVLQAHVTA